MVRRGEVRWGGVELRKCSGEENKGVRDTLIMVGED